MVRPLKLVLLLLSVASAAVSCVGGDVGDTCETRGASDECNRGNVCTEVQAQRRICMKICAETADCSSNEACDGADGSRLKACVPAR